MTISRSEEHILEIRVIIAVDAHPPPSFCRTYRPSSGRQLAQLVLRHARYCPHAFSSTRHPVDDFAGELNSGGSRKSRKLLLVHLSRGGLLLRRRRPESESESKSSPLKRVLLANEIFWLDGCLTQLPDWFDARPSGGGVGLHANLPARLPRRLRHVESDDATGELSWPGEDRP